MAMFKRSQAEQTREMLQRSHGTGFAITTPWARYGALVVLAVVCLGVGIIVVAVRSGESATFDRAVLLLFREPGDVRRLIGPRWIGEFWRDLTSLGSTTVLAGILLTVSAYFALTRKWADLTLVTAAIAGGQIISTVVKLFVDRSRPDLIPDAPMVFTPSFPSGHALLSAVTYLTLGALLSRLESRRPLKVFYVTVAAVLTVVIGVSRLALGVHWPTDVLAGWCVGVGWASLCSFVAQELRRRRKLEPLA